VCPVRNMAGSLLNAGGSSEPSLSSGSRCELATPSSYGLGTVDFSHFNHLEILIDLCNTLMEQTIDPVNFPASFESTGLVSMPAAFVIICRDHAS
jgi:hypothetical protein